MRSLLMLRRLQVMEVVVLVPQFCQNSRQKDKNCVVQGSGNNPFAPNSGRPKENEETPKESGSSNPFAGNSARQKVEESPKPEEESDNGESSNPFVNPDEIKINPQVEGNPFMEDEERTPYITPKASSNARQERGWLGC